MKHLQKIIVFGTFVLGCLFIIQIYWFKKAFDVAEKQFDHSIQVALKKVADSVSHDAEVKKLSSNFYYVNSESNLDDETLDSIFSKELLLRDINIDYELGVYNAEDDTLVYGHYVEATKRPLSKEENLITNNTVSKNFAIYFPSKKSYLASQLDVWIFSTVILLLMMGFFAYAIVSLLKEKRFAALKTDFINNMTHEFKTPVTNIRIAGDILKNKLSPHDEHQVYINILLKENEKLRRKIDEVLLGSSFDHTQKPQLSIINIHQLIKECAEAFEFKVQERGGRLQLEFDDSTTTMLADRDLLSQAINNVIDNAEKYSPGVPNIVVRTKNTNGGIEINIIDNGIGIEDSLQKKVFKKFYRIRTGDIHNVKGFGLGLNFVKNVVQSHRGSIALQSALNEGTVVKIFLPRL